MSTHQVYRYEESSAAAQRRAAELAQRELRLSQGRAAQATVAHQRVLQRLGESGRRASAVAAAQRRSRQALDAVGAREATLAHELAATRQDLTQLAWEAEATRAALEAAEQAVRAELARAARLEAEIGCEASRMAEAIAEAEGTLAEISALGRATAESLGELSPAEGEALAARQREIESRVRFLTQDAATAPVAMMTLLAMEANGYHLRETVSQQGLVAYFTRADAAHQIAVRTRPAARDGESAARWEVAAETFGMTGESCLYEIEDFETAVEDLDLGRLLPGDRVYPKDEPGRAALGRAARAASFEPLPPPRRDLWRRQDAAGRRRTERA
jgi:hypothetical protein